MYGYCYNEKKNQQHTNNCYRSNMTSTKFQYIHIHYHFKYKESPPLSNCCCFRCCVRPCLRKTESSNPNEDKPHKYNRSRGIEPLHTGELSSPPVALPLSYKRINIKGKCPIFKSTCAVDYRRCIQSYHRQHA